jgi:hypothetical protein
MLGEQALDRDDLTRSPELTGGADVSKQRDRMTMSDAYFRQVAHPCGLLTFESPHPVMSE